MPSLQMRKLRQKEIALEAVPAAAQSTPLILPFNAPGWALPQQPLPWPAWSSCPPALGVSPSS